MKQRFVKYERIMPKYQYFAEVKDDEVKSTKKKKQHKGWRAHLVEYQKGNRDLVMALHQTETYKRKEDCDRELEPIIKELEKENE